LEEGGGEWKTEGKAEEALEQEESEGEPGEEWHEPRRKDEGRKGGERGERKRESGGEGWLLSTCSTSS